METVLITPNYVPTWDYTKQAVQFSPHHQETKNCQFYCKVLVESAVNVIEREGAHFSSQTTEFTYLTPHTVEFSHFLLIIFMYLCVHTLGDFCIVNLILEQD